MAPPHHHKHHQHHLGHHGHRGENYSLAEYRLQPEEADLATGGSSEGVGAAIAGLSFSRATELSLMCVACLMCVVLWCAARQKWSPSGDEGGDGPPRAPSPREERIYRQLRNSYLSVYALAVFGDWIQGGYLYALYAEYGYNMRQIGLIFVIGYVSAATLGTYVSALGDIGGHRRNCVLYGIIYGVSCLTYHYEGCEIRRIKVP
jgi:hypothetical protein